MPVEEPTGTSTVVSNVDFTTKKVVTAKEEEEEAVPVQSFMISSVKRLLPPTTLRANSGANRLFTLYNSFYRIAVNATWPSSRP